MIDDDRFVDAVVRVARALEDIGFGTNRVHGPGCLEFIGMQLRDGAAKTDVGEIGMSIYEVSNSLEKVATSLDRIADAIAGGKK